MNNTTIKEINDALKHKYFDEVREYLNLVSSPKHEIAKSPGHVVKTILETPYEELDKREDGSDVESEPQKDVFYAWHKYRVLVISGVEKILPKNTETHTLVTDKGGVCVIRKPIGRILGKVVAKMSSVGKDPDLYEAGSIILRECKIYMEESIESDPDQLFSTKMAAVGSINMTFTQIKKN